MSKKIWKIILIISLILLLICVAGIGYYLYDTNQTQKDYEKLKKNVAKETEVPVTLEEIESLEFTGERDGNAATLPEDIFLDLENPIDFEELTSINPDIYAWIRIPNTLIDYPIAQRAGDDDYYLKHDMYGQPRFAGCIYTEDCNSKDFTDPNTLIYGHNMKNKTMFQNLHLFSNQTFFEENLYVYIYTPDKVLVYEIFAAYIYDDRHIMNSFDFYDEEVFATYLQDIFTARTMQKNIREESEVNTSDTIITLETCIGGMTKSRYLVQAVLISDGD